MDKLYDTTIWVLCHAAMVFLLFPLADCAKVYAARRQGDKTAYNMGRASFDPKVHLDLIGCLATFFFGFGWSKPVPISPVNMKKLKKGMVCVSLAKPLTYFAVGTLLCWIEALLSLAFLKGGMDSSVAAFLLNFFASTSRTAVCLGVFNLLPIPPFDGFNIVYYLAGRKFVKWYYSKYDTIHKASQIIIWGLILLPVITMHRVNPLGWLCDLVYGFVLWTGLMLVRLIIGR